MNAAEIPGRKRRPNYAFLAVLFFLCLYVGYCMGLLNKNELTLENVADKMMYAFTHPFPLCYTEATATGIGLALLVWMLFFAYYLSSLKNYMAGAEFGTSQWALPQEINKYLENKKSSNDNKIFSANLRMNLEDRVTERNNNVLVIGGSGSGKTFFYVMANALQNAFTSLIYTDPKGELLRKLGNILIAFGYKIKVLNLIDMEKSDRYNPLRYIRTEEDILKLITNIFANTDNPNTTKNDPFWENAEKLFLQALMLYEWMEGPKQGRKPSFRGVMELLKKAEIPEDENKLSDLDKLMYELDPTHPALIAYLKIRRGAADTIRTVFTSLNVRLAYLQNEKLLRILDDDDIDIPSIGEGINGNKKKRTALFCIIPVVDKSYNFVIGMLYTQLFQELYDVADSKYGGRLPIPVSIYMDEAMNVALPDNFDGVVSTVRSYGIGVNIIIQNLAQLKTRFKDLWESIVGNCDSLLYLGGNEPSSHEFIAKYLGSWTIDKRTHGESKGRNGSSSHNDDVLGRELLKPDEVRRLDNKKCITFIRGFNPVLDFKYKTYKDKVFKKAEKMGPYIHYGRAKAAMSDGVKGQQPSFDLIGREEIEYFAKQKKEGVNNIEVYEVSAKELLMLDLKSIFAEKHPEVREEELERFLASSEHREALRETAEQERVIKQDIIEKKKALGMETEENLLEKGPLSLVDLIAALDLSTSTGIERYRQIALGLEHGLSEQVILAYADPWKDGKCMEAEREMAEAAMKAFAA